MFIYRCFDGRALSERRDRIVSASPGYIFRRPGEEIQFTKANRALNATSAAMVRMLFIRYITLFCLYPSAGFLFFRDTSQPKFRSYRAWCFEVSMRANLWYLGDLLQVSLTIQSIEADVVLGSSPKLPGSSVSIKRETSTLIGPNSQVLLQSFNSWNNKKKSIWGYFQKILVPTIVRELRRVSKFSFSYSKFKWKIKFMVPTMTYVNGNFTTVWLLCDRFVNFFLIFNDFF